MSSVDHGHQQYLIRMADGAVGPVRYPLKRSPPQGAAYMADPAQVNALVEAWLLERPDRPRWCLGFGEEGSEHQLEEWQEFYQASKCMGCYKQWVVKRDRGDFESSDSGDDDDE